MTVADAIRTAAEHLSTTSDTARLDAELLMANVLGVSRSLMLLTRMRDEAEPHLAVFENLVSRRAVCEPVAHLLGVQEFFGLEFAVTPDTLIPRGDSETMVQAALDAAPADARVLDMGTGSGALLLAVLHHCPSATGIGIDSSAAALDIAAANCKRLGLAGRAQFLRASWLEEGWADRLGAFDLVLCNPPYVETDAVLDPDVRDYEPAAALFAGPDGLDDYRAIVPQLGKLLAPGGLAIFEIGATQEEAVTGLARDSGFAVTMRRDLAGRPRALLLR
ncbi:peptide chain release factor N(5)-glutamine methyltransferase [Qipengyuania qiaonensis]|uniref:Release factor glutamine methyltransferase n=1 Tax=Qipengyuania qiaonensis TaxID=2867240 RepID=A0ABS7J5J3_9SPHN|nr:peptide chain release factor N(5)-glutamine methyltransferase [Qipengyuania qiaonensis]MBX7481531.1 peptide chain release factor N(5)-glutamine methyltransferase [Qipengyuania qiaonensis]